MLPVTLWSRVGNGGILGVIVRRAEEEVGGCITGSICKLRFEIVHLEVVTAGEREVDERERRCIFIFLLEIMSSDILILGVQVVPRWQIRRY